MKSLLPRLFALFAIPVLMLSLAACGGGHGHNEERDRQPAFDVSGTWLATMDNVYLGKFNFKMSSKGALSGTLSTDHNAKADVAGAVSGYKAEFTISFPDSAYLASVEFHADQSNADGTLVDNAGHVHTLVLHK